MSKKIIGVLTLGDLAMSYREYAQPIMLALVSYVRERIPFRERRSALPEDVQLSFLQISRINAFEKETAPTRLILDRFSLVDTTLNQLTFNNGQFRDINLENTTFNNSSLKSVTFSYGANTLAIKFYGCVLEDVFFSGSNNLEWFHCQDSSCKFAHFLSKSFDNANFIITRFEDCSFIYTDFALTWLQGAAFDDCTIFFCNLTKCDVSLDQVRNARTLYGTSVRTTLLEEINEKYPHLFSPPRFINLRDGNHTNSVPLFKDSKGMYWPDSHGRCFLFEAFPDLAGVKASRLHDALMKMNIKIEDRASGFAIHLVGRKRQLWKRIPRPPSNNKG